MVLDIKSHPRRFVAKCSFERRERSFLAAAFFDLACIALIFIAYNIHALLCFDHGPGDRCHKNFARTLLVVARYWSGDMSNFTAGSLSDAFQCIREPSLFVGVWSK